MGRSKRAKKAEAVVARLDDLAKPESDPKTYRWLRLANGLECVVVHDPSAAAAADDEESDDDADDGASDDEADDGAGGGGGGGGGGRAAAALAVAAGCWDDPPEWPGLAHFCEHMLFMGSERHPRENAYDAFLQRHGGSDNA